VVGYNGDSMLADIPFTLDQRLVARNLGQNLFLLDAGGSYAREDPKTYLDHVWSAWLPSECHLTW
jgi:hypothetical protein